MKPQRSDVSALANAARELLAQGDAVGAERVLNPVMSDLRADPSVLHLMGRIKQAQQKWDEAEHFLRRAVAESLTDGSYYNDLGIVLQTRGDFQEALKVFRAAIALMPTAAPCRVNMVQCLMASGDFAAAERETRTYIDLIGGPEAWTLLGLVQRTQGRLDDALASAEEALRLAPNMRGLKHNRAIALDRLGRSKQALEAFEELARDDLEAPELAMNFARALFQEDRRDDAENVLERAVGHWPHAVFAHEMLARMRLMRGLKDGSTAILEAAAKAYPDDLTLRAACADFAQRNGLAVKARALLDEALRLVPGNPAFLMLKAGVLDSAGDIAGAVDALRQAERAVGASTELRRALIGPLLRSGQYKEALGVVRALRRDAPDDQYALASEATAMRLLDDPIYKQVCDPRLLQGYNIGAPKGYFTLENFNAALSESLRLLLKAANALDQALTGVIEAPRDLRTVTEPNVQEFLRAIEPAIRTYAAALKPEDYLNHRRGNHYRLRRCAASLLKSGAGIPNHVHEGGWISGIYVVETKGPQGGAIKFNEPPWTIAGCHPELWVDPKPGQLFLFPSYFWHGVEPLPADSERVSISFDIVPA